MLRVLSVLFLVLVMGTGVLADGHVVVHQGQGIGTFTALVEGITIASTDGVVDVDQGELSLASKVIVTDRGFEFVGSNIVVSAFRIYVDGDMVLEAVHSTEEGSGTESGILPRRRK